jgi:hypothetical protein
MHPLHVAETLGVVEALLDAGVDVRALDSHDRPVLTCPAATGDPVACRALLAAGADPNSGLLSRDTSTRTPLAEAKTRAVVVELLRAGADPKARVPISGLNALFSPAALTDPEATQLLVDAGACVNAVSSWQCPLCLARTSAVVEVLLAAGASMAPEEDLDLSLHAYE